MRPYASSRWLSKAAAVAAALVLGGSALAAPTSVTRWSTDARLQDWLDRDLGPYLAEVLSQHPRFRDQSLRFVRLHGDQTHADMDDFTRSVVLRLRPALQKAPGIRLWVPPAQAAQHDCSVVGAPDYEIAIEVLALDGGHHRIAVRALDVAEREWVPGFGREWQGELTRRQRSALNSGAPPDDGPGQRGNPFTEDQADLVARSLARDVGERLCGVAGAPVAVFLHTADGAPPVAARVARLLAHNLSASRDVTVTSDRDAADLQLDLHIVAIAGNLHQVWVNAEPSRDGIAHPPIGAQAYVAIAPHPQNRPRVGAARTAALAPRPLQQPAANAMATVEVVAPADSRNCASADPWRFGPPVSLSARQVDADGCFALELTARDDLIVFLLSVDSEYGAVRLLPSACRAFGRARSVLVRGERLRFPVAGNARFLAFRAPGRDGSRRFVAVAARDHRAARRIKAELGNWNDACAADSRTVSAQHSSERVARLHALVAQLKGRAEVQHIEVRYVSRGARVAAQGATGSTRNE